MAAPTLTFGTLKGQIQRELDLESEDFIDSTEMIDTFNEAVRECESHIHTLGLESVYFKRRAFLTLTNASNLVDLPSDIYDYKILRIVWAESGKLYTVKRQRLDISYEDMENERVMGSSSNDFYTYDVHYSTIASGPQLYLTPAARETTSTKAVIYYIRQANQMSADATLFDLPTSSINYVKKYVKYRAYYKEGHPNTNEAKLDLDEARKQMIETLATMVPDGDSTLEKDMSHYEEMS